MAKCRCCRRCKKKCVSCNGNPNAPGHFYACPCYCCPPDEICLRWQLGPAELALPCDQAPTKVYHGQTVKLVRVPGSSPCRWNVQGNPGTLLTAYLQDVYFLGCINAGAPSGCQYDFGRGFGLYPHGTFGETVCGTFVHPGFDYTACVPEPPGSDSHPFTVYPNKTIVCNCQTHIDDPESGIEGVCICIDSPFDYYQLLQAPNTITFASMILSAPADGGCDPELTDGSYSTCGDSGVPPESPPMMGAAAPGDPAEASVATPPAGPGTELKLLLAEHGFETSSSCDCNRRAAEINAWWAAGRLAAHQAEILGWLRAEQAKRNWREKARAAVLAVASGLAFKLDPRDPGPGLLDEAIRRADARGVSP